MNTNLRNNTEAAVATNASGELAGILELLASAGLAAEALFDGGAEWCPHCLSQVLAEAA